MSAKIQINYKSGISVIAKCDGFSVTKSAVGKTFEWENLDPRPLMMGIDDVESVWEL